MIEPLMGQAQVKKNLISLSGGKFAEAIFYNRPMKRVICFSTQLSCAVGCAFCASPSEDKTVNLTSDEMLFQIEEMYKYSLEDAKNQILFSVMGEGEPLLNYKNVLEVMHELPRRYKNCKISLSTSGVAPDKIKALAHEDFGAPFKLQISVHSMIEDTRKWFMPLAKSIAEIKEAIEYYHTHKPGAPVELNFALIKGVNDSGAEAMEIVKQFPNEYIKVSKFNPILRSEFESPSDRHILRFVKILEDAGLTVEFHQTDGSGIGAACGQTRGMRVQ